MAKKNKVGRPLKIDEVVLGKLEAAFNIGASDLEACKHAGINPDTLYEYQKRHPEYTELCFKLGNTHLSDFVCVHSLSLLQASSSLSS